MKYSLRIGKVTGIDIFIHWTFPLIILWVIAGNIMQGLGPEQLIWPVLFVLALFVCVTLHELGHAIAAKRYKIETKDITLLPIGGVARLENMPEKPAHELVVALAGPLVNVIIFVLLYALLGFSLTALPEAEMSFIQSANFLYMLAVANIYLVLFNLVPAFPMDGGRVLRALLGMRMDRLRATKISARVGQVLAIGFILLGLYLNPFLVVIGLFIIFSAQAEAGQVEIETVLKGHTVGEITMKEVPVLQKADSIGKAIDMLLNSQAKRFLVVGENNVPAGTLNSDGIVKALHEKGKDVTVGEAADRKLGFIDVAEPLDKALMMIQAEKYAMLLVTKDNHVIGTLDQDNIIEYIMILKVRPARSIF